VDVLRVRITLQQAPSDTAFAVQIGADGSGPAASGPGDIALETSVRVRDPVTPDFGGPTVFGPPGGRFLYVCSRSPRCQPEKPFDRRAKVPLSGISPTLVEQALQSPHAALHVRIAGTARDGGAACASVPLLGDGWTIDGAPGLRPD